jgi:hypothetical protein
MRRSTAPAASAGSLQTSAPRITLSLNLTAIQAGTVFNLDLGPDGNTLTGVWSGVNGAAPATFTRQ